MTTWLESEWQKLGGGALVLLPIAIAFRGVVAVRRFLYRARILPQWRARVPVIVVGNITVGGTGKTPLVLAIVEKLQSRGWNPGVPFAGDCSRQSISWSCRPCRPFPGWPMYRRIPCAGAGGSVSIRTSSTCCAVPR